MQYITDSDKLFDGKISELITSVSIMILFFVICIASTVFINTNKAYEVLCIEFIYLSGIIYLYKKHPIDFAKEYHKPLLAKYTIIGLFIGLLILLLSFLEYYFLSEQSQAPSVSVNENNHIFVLNLVNIISACIIIPISEEILFRYYFFNIIRIKYGLYVGGAISILLFVGIHYFNPELLPIAIQGLLYTYVYYKSDSIFSSIILHIINNSIWHFITYSG